MAELIRAEARAALWRWREVIAGGLCGGLGLRGVQSFGLWVWLGWGALALGAVLILTGVPRARFRARGRGPGLVEVDELQLRYMGPFSGGEMALDTVMVVALGRMAGAPGWVLTNAFGERITIPVEATGADSLFDAFSALPGFRMERALSAIGAGHAEVVTIWRRPHAAVDTTGISPHG